MSSPEVRRSVSRGRSRTPAKVATAADNNNDDARSLSAERPNGARDRTRSPTRSRSPSRDRSRSRSRSRSYRARSYSRSRSRSATHSRSRSPSIPRSAKIVIEKLTKNVNQGHLREIFSSYGTIHDLEMPMNPQFMMNKGIAYILYDKAEYAEAAIAHMHEAQLDGALINEVLAESAGETTAAQSVWGAASAGKGCGTADERWRVERRQDIWWAADESFAALSGKGWEEPAEVWRERWRWRLQGSSAAEKTEESQLRQQEQESKAQPLTSAERRRRWWWETETESELFELQQSE